MTTEAPPYTPHDHPFTDGQIVRHKAKDLIVRLDGINPDPDFDVEDETWAEAHALGNHRTIELDGPHEIELFTWDEATREKIAKEVASSLHSGFGDNLEIHETEVDGPDVYVEGASWDGVPITFTVVIEGLEVGR